MNKFVVIVALLVMLAIAAYFYYFENYFLKQNSNVQKNQIESLEGLPEELDSLLSE